MGERTHTLQCARTRTGRKALFATGAYFKRFEGWGEEDSRSLLDYLAPLPHRLQYQWQIRWKPDTLIVWDNRFLQHAGIHDYENGRRHLVRTTVIGERPIQDAAGKIFRERGALTQSLPLRIAASVA